MNRSQIRYIYDKCKEMWIKLGKEDLIDEAKIEEYCLYGEAITQLLSVNSMSIDTNHGGPTYDKTTDRVVSNVIDNSDPNIVVGTISFGHDGIYIQITKRRESQEAHSSIYFNGEFTTGTISRINNNSELVSVSLGKDYYTIKKDFFKYASIDEGGKIVEVFNALATRTNKLSFTPKDGK